MKTLKEVRPHSSLWMKTDHFLTGMMMAANLGAFWHFPYITYVQGGGVFLIPYLIVFIFIGRPISIMNFSLGQFTNQSSIKVYEYLGVAWKGFGISQSIVMYFCMTYYSFNAALLIRYSVNSVIPVFPWGLCDSGYSNSCLPLFPVNSATNGSHSLTSSAELYLAQHLLHSSSMYEMVHWEMPNFELCFYLALTWTAVLCYVLFDVDSTSKLCYVTGTLPFLMMSCFCIRVAFIPGSIIGFVHFMTPTVKSLFSFDIWSNSLIQCYFTLGLPIGIFTFASMRAPIHHNISRLINIMMIFNMTLSLISGLTVFLIFGNLSWTLRTQISHVIKEYRQWSPYIAYSAGLVHFRGFSNVFAVIFFFTLFVASLHELAAFAQILVLNIEVFTQRFSRVFLMTSVCCVASWSAMLYTIPEGSYLTRFSDLYSNLYVRVVLVPLQIIIVCFSYGLRYWCWDMEFMEGSVVPLFTRWSLVAVIPVILLMGLGLILMGVISLFAKLGSVPYVNIIFGMAIWPLIVLPIPLMLAKAFYDNRGDGWRRTLERSFSSPMWWPSLLEVSNRLVIFRMDKMEREQQKLEESGSKGFLNELYDTLTSKQP